VPPAFGLFEVRRQLAEGFEGTIFLVESPTAVGVGRCWHVDEEDRWARAVLDLDRAAALEDKRVATLLERHIKGDEGYIVLERRGDLLAERLASGPMTPASARAMVAAVAEVVEAAHRAGLHHLALTPRAITVGENPEDVRVGDFGVHYLVPGSQASKTTPGANKDIQDLGDLLTQALVGAEARTQAGRAGAHKLATADLERLPPGFAEVIRRATASPPQYATVTAFGEALAGLHTVEPTESALSGAGPAPKVGEVVAGKYRIVRELGQGGMGCVYEAEHVLLPGKRAALKVLHQELASDPRIAERFMSEARTASRVRHPSVVTVEDVIDDDRLGPVVVMELLQGESLDVLVRQGPMPLPQIFSASAQILDALGWAHQRGVVHRDIKPGNLFLAVDDRGELRAKLLDFGIARSTEEASRTRPGQFVGTRRYASPEQRTDSATVDLQTDLYSFGATLFEMLTGRALRNTTDGAPASFLDASLRLANVPPKLAEVVRRALEPDKSARFADAAAMKAALGEAAAEAGLALDPGRASSTTSPPGSPITTPPSTPNEQTKAPPDDARTTGATPQKRRLWPLAATLAIVAGAAAFFILRPAEKPEGLPLEGLRETCRTLSRSLVAQRHPDGKFSATQHNPTSGGDTAQPLAALLHARRGCQALDPSDEVAIASALEKQKMSYGWESVAVQDRALYASTVANAWALMAFALDVNGGEENLRRLVEARKLLLAAQLPNGAFPLAVGPETDTHAMPYPTALALWALVVAEPVARDEAAVAARKRASAWLRRAMLGQESVDVRGVAGLSEQALYVILLERRLLGEREPATDALVQSYAHDALMRCAFEGKPPKCQRQTFANGRLEMQGHFGRQPEVYVTYWFPYMIAAAHAAAADPAVDAATRAELSRVADWGAQQLVSTAVALTGMANYEVSEYLVAVALLLSP